MGSCAGETTGKGRLEQKVKAKIKEAVERQLDAMKFYRDDDVSPEIQRLMVQTPRTNLGARVNFHMEIWILNVHWGGQLVSKRYLTNT